MPIQFSVPVFLGGLTRWGLDSFLARPVLPATTGDAVAKAILSDAAIELVRAASSVRDRLRLEEAPYDVVLSGGTFAAVPSLEADVARRLETPQARVRRLAEEPAIGAVKLAIEALDAPAAGAPAP